MSGLPRDLWGADESRLPDDTSTAEPEVCRACGALDCDGHCPAWDTQIKDAWAVLDSLRDQQRYEVR